jgi:YD repeat-containing protein
LTYSPGGRLTGLTDPLGQVHRYGYDPAGRLVQDVSPLGPAFTLSRKGTEARREITVRNAAGAATVFEITEDNSDLAGQSPLPTGPAPRRGPPGRDR